MTPLTKTEAKEIQKILEDWPNRMGCVLVPAKQGERAKNGWKPLDWGWKGHRFGNFDYLKLQNMLLEQETYKLCPVTALGILRGARNFKDHMDSYHVIIEALQLMLPSTNVQKMYNELLKTNACVLASYFEEYAEKHAESLQEKAEVSEEYTNKHSKIK